MAKKELGSFTRTSIAVVSGFVIGKSGMSAETLTMIASNLELLLQHTDTVVAVLGIVLTQIWSLSNKKKQKELEKENEILKHNTKDYNP